MKRAPLPDPPPPTPAQLAKARAVKPDTLQVPPCPKGGRSYLTCRDPRSYLKTNEPRLYVLTHTIANLGGGYTGVGSAQNYTLIAKARSRWAWLFDYDRNVVRWHRIMRAMILDAPTRQTFVAHFTHAAIEHGAAILAAAYHGDADLASLQKLYRNSAPTLHAYYQRLATAPTWRFTWLGNDSDYRYVRLLYQQGRIQILEGNMLDVHAMQSIAAAARALHIPIRVYYPSNAAEFWEFTPQYRKNVRDLPFDRESVVVQTISSLHTGFGQKGYWHYNIQYGFAQQQLLSLPGYTREKQLLHHRIRTDSTELTLSDMPCRLP